MAREEKNHLSIEPHYDTDHTFLCIHCNRQSESDLHPFIQNLHIHMTCSYCKALNSFRFERFPDIMKYRALPKEMCLEIDKQIRQLLSLQKWLSKIESSWKSNKLDFKTRQEFLNVKDPYIKQTIASYELERLKRLNKGLNSRKV